ncbi:hypothetical protein FQA47_002633 [Oryzias melastigma]|uniref:Uncharacterized protein n=1 Tax=Oryzias melastigma TaxID=30732 RepID=A0A834FJ45_ORYME|nr:hypothetical protein FQA47_002633 [Oryzias melastigma]
MIREICQEESLGSDCKTLSKENSEQVTLRDGCLKRLKQIHAQLQTPSEVQTHLQLQDCAPPMMIHLTKLQEVQALTLLQALADRNLDGVQALRDKYIYEIQTQRFSSLLHLLNTDFPDPNLTDNSSKDQSRSSCGSDEEHMSKASAEAPGADSIKSELDEVPAAEDKKELCSGCGAVIEDLPYLEISCASDVQAVAPDVEANSEESSATATPESYEKQESLIALAWSKPTDCDTADAGQSPDVKGSEMTPILPAQSTETVQQGDGEEQKSALLHVIHSLQIKPQQ